MENLQDIIKKIEYYCAGLGLKELTLKEIGTKKKDVFRFQDVYKFGDEICTGGTRMSAFTWEEMYLVLRGMNSPEIVLDHIISTGYLAKRNSGKVVDYYEKELEKTLLKLEEKYGNLKVKRLKERLKIS